MRGVGLVQKKCADQQEQDNAHGRVNDGGFAEAAIVGAHQSEHSQESEDQPGGLADQEIIGVREFFVRGDRGGAENHHRAQQAEHDRHTK